MMNHCCQIIFKF